MANPLGDYIPALRYGVSKVQSNEMQGITGQLTTAGTFEVAGAYAGTLTLTAATNVTLPTSGVLLSDNIFSGSKLVSGTALLAWPAIGTNSTAISGTLSITGLAANSKVLLGRQESSTDGVVIVSHFVSAASSLHVVFGAVTGAGVAVGTATISYLYTTP